MTQFRDGQEVEVEGIWFKRGETSREIAWRKAKIVPTRQGSPAQPPDFYGVQFPDGTRAVFDAEHIRPIGDFELGIVRSDFR